MELSSVDDEHYHHETSTRKWGCVCIVITVVLFIGGVASIALLIYFLSGPFSCKGKCGQGVVYILVAPIFCFGGGIFTIIFAILMCSKTSLNISIIENEMIIETSMCCYVERNVISPLSDILLFNHKRDIGKEEDNRNFTIVMKDEKTFKSGTSVSLEEILRMETLLRRVNPGFQNAEELGNSGGSLLLSSSSYHADTTPYTSSSSSPPYASGGSSGSSSTDVNNNLNLTPAEFEAVMQMRNNQSVQPQPTATISFATTAAEYDTAAIHSFPTAD